MLRKQAAGHEKNANRHAMLGDYRAARRCLNIAIAIYTVLNENQAVTRCGDRLDSIPVSRESLLKGLTNLTPELEGEGA